MKVLIINFYIIIYYDFGGLLALKDQVLNILILVNNTGDD